MNRDEENAIRDLVESAAYEYPRPMQDRLTDDQITIIDLRISLSLERDRRREAGWIALLAWVVIVMALVAKIGGLW